MWPEIAELKGTHWHDTLMAQRGAVTPDAAVDSLYKAHRCPGPPAHSVRRAGRTPTPQEKAAAQKKAEATLAQVRKGANFDKLACELSEDPGQQGRQRLSAAEPRRAGSCRRSTAPGWALAPGQVSGVVETPFGFHIIKRPTLAEAREHIVDYLQERAGVHLDSLYMDSLAAAHKIEVLPGAPAAMRAAAESQDQSRKSDKALVKFTGGALTVKDYLRWVRALPPQYTAQLREANDTMLTKFARILTQNVLLLREADANKIAITPLEWASLKRHYEGQLDTLRAEMGLQEGDLTDSSIALAERKKVARAQGREVFRPAHRRQDAPSPAAVGPRHAPPRPAAVCRPRCRREPGRRAGHRVEGQGGLGGRRRVRCSAHPAGRRCRVCRQGPAPRRPGARHPAPGRRRRPRRPQPEKRP